MKLQTEAPGAGLDAIDRHILAVLQQDARTTNKELAAVVGLSQSACLRRVQALEARRVLKGYRADVDPKALGIGLQAMVSLQLKEHARAAFDAMRAHLRTLPEVVAVYSLGGADDLLVHVAVRDSDHLRDFTMDHLATRPECRHMETMLIFEHETAALPLLR